MKKILAGVTAFAAVLCMFAGCGKTEDKKKNDKDNAAVTTEAGDSSGKKDDKDNDKDSKTDNKDKDEKKEDKKDDKKDGGNSSDTSYEEAVNEYFDAVNSGDFRKLLEMQMPEGGIDVLKLMYMEQQTDDGEKQDVDAMIDEYAQMMVGSESKIKFNRIVETEELGEDDIESLKEACAAYTMIIDYINDKGGVDKVDLAEMEKEFEDLDPKDLASNVIIDDAKYVTIEYTEDGRDEPEEEEFCLYRVNGGEWRVDNSMMAYMRKAKKASANSRASSLSKAGNTALVEMDEENVLPDLKNALICSDPAKNLNLPDSFDTDLFYKKVEKYFSDNSKLDWFMAVNDGCVIYTVAVSKGEKQVGIYPANRILNANGSTDSDESVGKKSFDELYDICAGIVK